MSVPRKDDCPPAVYRHLKVLSDLWPYDDGPAHIVVADYNLEDHLIQACIDGIDRGDTYSSEEIPAGDPVYAATRAVLVSFLSVPEVERVGWIT